MIVLLNKTLVMFLTGWVWLLLFWWYRLRKLTRPQQMCILKDRDWVTEQTHLLSWRHLKWSHVELFTLPLKMNRVSSLIVVMYSCCSVSGIWYMFAGLWTHDAVMSLNVFFFISPAKRLTLFISFHDTDSFLQPVCAFVQCNGFIYNSCL